MDRVLVVSGNDAATAAIVGLIRDAYPQCTQSVVSNGSEARRAVSENSYDVVVINCPLSDEYGNELAEHVTTVTTSSCIMLVRSENSEQVGERMEDFGVLVVSKPLSKQLFYQALKFISATRKRMLGLQNENVKLHKRLEEMRIINRAKFALMQYLGFTETQAHRHLEKQAMDMRCTKLEVALSVIKTYDS
jgi:response regulator NasT